MPFSLQSLAFVVVFVHSLLASADVTGGKNCSCGFYDINTEQVFTDSIIVYFNESRSLPKDFVAEDYQHKYEKDWNAIYRQGADPANLQFNDSESLQLFVSPHTSDHLVNGAEIRTVRRDIQHGSFRTLLKSPRKTSRGSSMSMMWQYNETEVAEISVMNTNDPSRAWVGGFVGGEFTSRDLGVNFSTALNSTVADQDYTTLGGVLGNGSLNPWEYTEYRIDWTKELINFYIGGNLTRSILQKENQGMPSVPSPFYFKHWSTGNTYSMEGPPNAPSVANLGWIRMFFNSSSTTEDEHVDFAARCSIADACSMNDVSLRGSTPFTEHATQNWKQKGNKSVQRMPALWISVICISFSSFLLVHALIRRAPWRKQSMPASNGHTPPSAVEKVEPNPFESSEDALALQDPPSVPSSVMRPLSSNYSNTPTDDLAIERALSPDVSMWGGSTHGGPSRAGSVRFESRGTTPRVPSPYSSSFNTTMEELPPAYRSQVHLSKDGKTIAKQPSERTIAVALAPAPEDKIPMETVTESTMPAPRMRAHPPPPHERIDYLAGLVAVCALLVTVMHFGLTFVPGMVVPGAPIHYKSEFWARQIISPFILNQMWLGVFFTTSVRFLVAGYLRDGDMQHLAKAAVRRTPRLMIPVSTIALLEYFLVDCGATTYLRYLPSLTWSNWPYVTRFPTIGHFISEVLELIYLVPNAVPQITFNYCTGVLWTIAVQLQGSWLVLCGAIVVYEIHTPWKRMLYYIFCLVNHWYAQSWGSYLWLGLLLTDLDITYKYKRWLHARPLAYYPLITFCWLCVAIGFSVNLIANWTSFNFAAYEHNIHPDPSTGEPIWNTANAGYPAYFVPRLNGLLFAGGMQAIVELSPTVQYVLSRPFLLVLFPHIFTIYLVHGLVFWTWGSWLMIVIAERGFGFGINVTVVGITSYILLFAILPIITPIIEALGKDITALVWTTAIEKPPARRRTLFPFPDDLFKRREEKSDVESMGTTSLGSVASGSGRTTPSEKGKLKGKVKVREIEPCDNEGKGKEQVRSHWEK
ncbi:glycoside hydrolase family 16 protein [Melanomma pulvis-pyrius CBS 109.77]|uniref:Glycoside hydrolase family 16 protein n=1 Tax=Melanomma pulvis-pyrius CBS 109.77 TaxID=1314802 RepID=A0A6A6X8H5_9PLEO|nr:glycoside hydrolase family 16 protein [Melanomma pulvis-pyrius CBS 109.77]